MNDLTIAEPIAADAIRSRILTIRGVQVMLAPDLAMLYSVPTKRLNEQVKRNIERFPERFMFQLTAEEVVDLRSQIATSNMDDESLRSQIATSKRGGTRYRPYAFTEYGIAMLSSVLRSDIAIQVNINIMRAFIAIRQAVAAMQTADLRYEQLSHKVDQLNAYVEELLHDQNDINEQQEQTNNEVALQIEAINDALDQLRDEKAKPRKPIGFKTNKK